MLNGIEYFCCGKIEGIASLLFLQICVCPVQKVTFVSIVSRQFHRFFAFDLSECMISCLGFRIIQCMTASFLYRVSKFLLFVVPAAYCQYISFYALNLIFLASCTRLCPNQCIAPFWCSCYNIHLFYAVKFFEDLHHLKFG